jgi:hypothetical protein
VVVNETFDQTVAVVRGVLLAARTQTARLSGLASWIRALDF